MTYTIRQVNQVAADRIAEPILKKLGELTRDRVYTAKFFTYDLENFVVDGVLIQAFKGGLLGRFFPQKIVKISRTLGMGYDDICVRSFRPELITEEDIKRLVPSKEISSILNGAMFSANGAVDYI